jgi:hypothetical protein
MLISAINNTELCRLLLEEMQQSLADIRIQTLVGYDYVQLEWPDDDVRRIAMRRILQEAGIFRSPRRDLACDAETLLNVLTRYGVGLADC